MGKRILCSEVGFDCPGQIDARDADEALSMAAAHVKAAHGIDEPTADLVDRVLAAMRDVVPVAAAPSATVL